MTGPAVVESARPRRLNLEPTEFASNFVEGPRIEQTSFLESAYPSQVKSILIYVETKTTPGTKTYYPGCYNHAIMGCATNFNHAPISPLSGLYNAIAASTTVPMDSLLSAIYRSGSARSFEIHGVSPVSGMYDLAIQYFTNTTQIVNAVLNEPIIQPLPAAEHRRTAQKPSYIALARRLASTLGMTLEDLGRATSIGRTTFSSWKHRIPRSSTLRQFNRVHALVRALERAIGADAAGAWLHAGNPSPAALLREGAISEVERSARLLIFSASPPSSSRRVSGYTLSDLPGATPYGQRIEKRKQAIRGRVKVDR